MKLDWVGVIKRYFDKGYYDKANVATFVVKNKITKEQYAVITGEAYNS